MSCDPLPAPQPEACLITSRASRYRGGIIIAEDVWTPEEHFRRMSSPDGYRPEACGRCGNNRLHVHDYPSQAAASSVLQVSYGSTLKELHSVERADGSIGSTGTLSGNQRARARHDAPSARRWVRRFGGDYLVSGTAHVFDSTKGPRTAFTATKTQRVVSVGGKPLGF